MARPSKGSTSFFFSRLRGAAGWCALALVRVRRHVKQHDYIRWCFKDLAAAEAFASYLSEAFGVSDLRSALVIFGLSGLQMM